MDHNCKPVLYKGDLDDDKLLLVATPLVGFLVSVEIGVSSFVDAVSLDVTNVLPSTASFAFVTVALRQPSSKLLSVSSYVSLKCLCPVVVTKTELNGCTETALTQSWAISSKGDIGVISLHESNSKVSVS